MSKKNKYRKNKENEIILSPTVSDMETLQLIEESRGSKKMKKASSSRLHKVAPGHRKSKRNYRKEHPDDDGSGSTTSDDSHSSDSDWARGGSKRGGFAKDGDDGSDTDDDKAGGRGSNAAKSVVKDGGSRPKLSDLEREGKGMEEDGKSDAGKGIQDGEEGTVGKESDDEKGIKDGEGTVEKESDVGKGIQDGEEGTVRKESDGEKGIQDGEEGTVGKESDGGKGIQDGEEGTVGKESDGGKGSQDGEEGKAGKGNETSRDDQAEDRVETPGFCTKGYLTYAERAPLISDYLKIVMDRSAKYMIHNEATSSEDDKESAKSYVQRHKIKEMFDMFLASLLKVQPDSPVDFLHQTAHEMNRLREIERSAQENSSRCPCPKK